MSARGINDDVRKRREGLPCSRLRKETTETPSPEKKRHADEPGGIVESGG